MEAVNNKSLQTCVQSNTLDATTNCSSAINLSKRSLTWELNKKKDLIKFNAQVNYVDIISTHNNKFNAIAIATTSTQKLTSSDRTALQITNNGSPNEHFMHKNDNDDICDNDNHNTTSPLDEHLNENKVNCENSNAASSSAIESNEEAFQNTNNKHKTPEIKQNDDDSLKQASVENCHLNNNQAINENVELPTHEEAEEEAAAAAKEEQDEAATQQNVEAEAQQKIEEVEEAKQEQELETAAQEKIELEAAKTVENEILHENSLETSLPVDCAPVANPEHEHNQSVRSRCSSVSSTASSSSSNSSSTPHLVIDQPFVVETQQPQQAEPEPEAEAETEPVQSSRKRKSSNSSYTDNEAPPAKQAHLYCSSTDQHVSDDVQSPLKLKIKCTPKPTPVDEELSDFEYQAQKLTTLSSSVTSLLNIVRNNVYSRSSTCNIGAKSTIKDSAPEAHQEVSAVPATTHVEVQDKKDAEFAVRESDEKVTNNVAAAAEEPARIKPRLLKCVQCQTLHEYGHFFMHSYQKHQRYLCLYCKGSFRTAEKLSVHLEIKHDLEQNHFNSEEAMRKYVDDANTWEQNNKYIMCCTCQHVFVDHEPFSNHDCSVYMQPCSLCGQMGRHSNHCKAHPDASRRNKFSASLQQKSKPPNSITFPQNSYDAGVTDCDTETQTVVHHANESIEEQQTITTQNFYGEINQLCNFDAQTMGVPAENAREMLGMEVQQQEDNNAKELENSAHKLVVPKFKLRVPKEFQKSVDAVISSSEDTENEESATEDDAEEESAEEEQEKSEIQQQQQENETENDSTQNTIETSNGSENQVNVEEPEQNQEQTVEPLMMEKDSSEELANLSAQAQPEAEQKNTIAHTNGPTEQWAHTPPASPSSARAPEAMAKITLTDATELQQTEQSAEQVATAETIFEMQPDAMITPTTSGSSVPTEETANEEPDVNMLPEVSKEMHNVNVTAAVVNMSEHADQQQEHIDEVQESESMEIGETSATDIQVADEDALPIALQLKKPLDEYNAIDFIRLCILHTSLLCLYCNHARRIAVNAHSLVLHLLEQHRYTAVVESITEEQLQTDTLVEKLKSFLPDIEDKYMNASSYNGLSLKEGETAEIVNCNERLYECFMCRFESRTYKNLYLHNRKMHLRAQVLCIMCRAHFANFSEILCHMCPGKAHKVEQLDLKYRCCLCNLPNITSTFRLMVHLRMKHNSCDVCLENCFDQIRLSLHVFKHKVRHLCYRCGIAYRNKQDIENHLFWKHSTEGIKCKRCLRKRWRHVYHFCTPPAQFPCDSCGMSFSKAMYLNVHAREHAGELKYVCSAENCEEKFVSRRLLEKHASKMHALAETTAEMITDTTAELPEKTDITENDQEMKMEAILENVNETDELKPMDERKQDEDVAEKETTTEKVIESNAEKTESTTQDSAEVNLEDNAKNIEKENTVEDIAASTPLSNKCKKSKRRKNKFNYLNLQAPNLSESDSSSSDSDTSDDESIVKSADPVLEKTQEINVESKTDETNVETAEKQVETKTSEDNISKVMQIWKNFIEDRDNKMPVEETKEQQMEEPSIAEKAVDTATAPMHVASGDHDYCLLMSPPSPQKKSKKHKKSLTATSSPIKIKQRHSTHNDNEENDAEEQSSSDSSSDDDDSCCSDENCSCSDNSRNSSDSDSDSSAASNESTAQHKKNNTKEVCKSPHKKHNKQQEAVNSSTENKQELAEEQTMEQAETSAPEKREPEFLESDLATSESDSSEEFYDQHPLKESSLLQQRLQLIAQTDAAIQNNALCLNGEQQTASPQHDVNTNNKKKFKRKREKRNLNNSNVQLHSFDQQAQQAKLYQETVVAHNYMQADHNLFYNNFSSTPQFAHDTTQRYAADQTMLAASHGFSEGGGSSSEPDGPLKRSKRKRRPNKFYGYTSDDESMNMSHGQRMMIGMRAFKPTPPPQLTWHKDDLPTPSKSILNSSMPKVAKNNTKLARNNLENAFSEFSELIGQDGRARTFGIAAGGKVGGGGAFYKRAAKRSNVKSRKVSSAEEECHQLPPIPRLKIKPTQLVLNLPENNTTDNEAMQSTSTNNLEQEAGEGSTTSSTSSSEDEKEESKPSRPRPRLTQPVPSTQATIVLPSQLIAPPVPKTTAFNHSIPPALLPNPDFATLQYFKVNNIRYPIRPPAGARQAREGESVYCYCRCPYDEVSEMIACDGANCVIEWFHFECVGIMMAPQGKWYCAECRPKYVTELYAAR